MAKEERGTTKKIAEKVLAERLSETGFRARRDVMRNLDMIERINQAAKQTKEEN